MPFGDIIDTWDGAETFDRDCSFEGLDEAKLCFEHGETIGRITKAESTDDGLHITARISDTARGRDAMTLIRDGVLDSFSVGFIPLESQKDRDGITHRRKVRLLETSIVSWPAYQNAKMTKSAAPAVEQRKETMENNTASRPRSARWARNRHRLPSARRTGATANTCRPSREATNRP